jgi:hypothetical protein
MRVYTPDGRTINRQLDSNVIITFRGKGVGSKAEEQTNDTARVAMRTEALDLVRDPMYTMRRTATGAIEVILPSEDEIRPGTGDVMLVHLKIEQFASKAAADKAVKKWKIRIKAGLDHERYMSR